MSGVSGARACGSCQACCELVGVSELGKAPGERCRHQCGAGCAIYAGRPSSCRTFTCLWLEGAFPKHLKPNKTGFVPTVAESNRTGQHLVLHGRSAAAAAAIGGALKRYLETVNAAGKHVFVTAQGELVRTFAAPGQPAPKFMVIDGVKRPLEEDPKC